MCSPQPDQVAFPHRSQRIALHMIPPLPLAKEPREKSWFLRVILVALTTLGLWDTLHNLVDMLAATGP